MEQKKAPREIRLVFRNSENREETARRLIEAVAEGLASRALSEPKSQQNETQNRQC